MKSLFAKYDTIDKISFDYAVVEKRIRFKCSALEEVGKTLGHGIHLRKLWQSRMLEKLCLMKLVKNVHVINEMGVPIVCMGLKDIIISASPEGILVADKEAIQLYQADCR